MSDVDRPDNEKPKCKQKQKKEVITCLVKLGIEGKYRPYLLSQIKQ